jgi:hypothetical protein
LGNLIGQDIIDWDLLFLEKLNRYEHIRGVFHWDDKEYERFLLPFPQDPSVQLSFYILDIWMDIADETLFNVRLVIDDDDSLQDIQIEVAAD